MVAPPVWAVPAAPIVELVTVLFLALVAAIVWFIVVTVLHITLTIVQVAVAEKHPVAGLRALGCGSAAAKVVASFRKINTLAEATVQWQVAAAVSAIFVNHPFIRRFVLVSVHRKNVLTSSPVEENLSIWAELLEAVAPNCNDVILMAPDILLGEVCVSADSGIRVQEAGAVMTTKKVVILDLLGFKPVVYKVQAFTKNMVHNLNATNGTTFTVCAAAAAKALVLQTAPAIVRAATGIKVRDWP